MTAVSFTAAYRAARNARLELAPEPPAPRTPLLVHAAHAAAAVTPHVGRFRRAALSIGGFAAITVGAFQAAPLAGWLTLGASALVLEWLTTSDRQ